MEQITGYLLLDKLICLRTRRRSVPLWFLLLAVMLFAMCEAEDFETTPINNDADSHEMQINSNTLHA